MILKKNQNISFHFMVSEKELKQVKERMGEAGTRNWSYKKGMTSGWACCPI